MEITQGTAPRPRGRRRISRTDVIAIVLFTVLAVAATVTYIAVRKDARRDNHAKSLLRSAARQMETYYGQHDDFEVSPLTTGTADDAANRMHRFAPGIAWQWGALDAQAKLGAVGFRYDRTPGAAAADRYILQTVSETGDTFVYYRNERGGVNRCRIPDPKILGAPPHEPSWTDPTATAPSVAYDCTKNQW